MAATRKIRRSAARTLKSFVRAVRKSSKKRVASLAPPVRRAVKRIVNKGQETKYVMDVITTGEPTPIYGDIWPQGVVGPPPGPNGNAQVFPVVPALTEGDDDFERIGNKIRPTRFEVDVDLFFNNLSRDVANLGDLDACAWDLTAHVWWGFARRFNSQDDTTANKTIIAENLLLDGLGAPLRWLGGPVDEMFKINTDYFRNLKHRSVRLYKPLGDQNTASLQGAVTTYYPQRMSAKMKLYFKTPQQLKYNENATTPENFAPIVIIGYQHNDNTQAANTYSVNPPLLATQAPALLTVIKSHMFYKDA